MEVAAICCCRGYIQILIRMCINERNVAMPHYHIWSAKMSLKFIFWARLGSYFVGSIDSVISAGVINLVPVNIIFL
jgi:hypothetical protein